jgi:hypothetical protein
MRRTTITSALVTAVTIAVVSGCATTIGGSPVTPDALPPGVSPTPNRTDLKLAPTRLGETVGYDYTSGTPAVTFSIDSVTVDPPCDPHGTKPEHGHTLLMQAHVTTTDDVPAAQDLGFLLYFSSFTEIAKDGTPHTADPSRCIDKSRELPGNLEPNQTYSGLIQIVVPEANGTIAIQDPLTGAETQGWQWTY